MIDERYSKGHHYTKGSDIVSLYPLLPENLTSTSGLNNCIGLSKWIRQRLQHQSDFNHSMKLLQAFTESMMVDGDANDLSKSCDQRYTLHKVNVC